MKGFKFKRTAIAAAVATCSSVAFAQSECDQEIRQVEQDLQQMQVDPQLRSEVRDLLLAAEQNPTDCRGYVAQAEQLVNERAQSSQSQQQMAQSGSSQQGVERASNIMGQTVTDSQGEELGSIDDLAIDMTNGELAYVVLSTGGMLTGKEVGVAANMLQPNPQGDGYVAQISQQQIDSAQSLPDDNWPAQPTIGGGQSSGGGTVQPASELIGQSVKDSQGNELGEIEDFAVDMQQGKLAYVAVAAGNLTDQKVVGVPTQSLQRDQEGFVANVSQQELQQAQELPEDNWPQQPAVASSGQSQQAGTMQQQPGGVMQSSYLYGLTVTNPQGETLGQIEDFALDMQQGKIAYIAIKTSDGRQVGVPVEMLQPSPQGRGYVADIDSQQLQNAQALPQQNWPAQPSISASGGQMASFSSLDRNQDGYISRDEAEQAGQQVSQNFGQIDQNSDQQIDRTEFSAFEGSQQ